MNALKSIPQSNSKYLDMMDRAFHFRLATEHNLETNLSNFYLDSHLHSIRGHTFSMCAKSFKKLTFHTT